MKTRPWPLILLAIFQICSPLGTLLFNAWALGVKPMYVLGWILEKPTLQVFESLFLMPIAGLAIYQMKAWSYVVFFCAMVWSIGANLRNWHYASHTYPIVPVLLVYALQVGLAIYFLIPSVRKTYLDARVRWWEAKRRFSLTTPVSIESAGQAREATLLNISEGGMLVQSPQSLEGVQDVQLRFRTLDIPFEVPGRIMYTRPHAGGGSLHGIQFLHTPESQRRFRRLVKGLEFIGVPDRDPEARKPWYQGMAEWVSGLLKTGKGWVPEVKTPRKE